MKTPFPMSELEKLEYIHCAIQEVQNGIIDDHMIAQALSFVEDIREPHLHTTGKV